MINETLLDRITELHGRLNLVRFLNNKESKIMASVYESELEFCNDLFNRNKNPKEEYVPKHKQHLLN